MRISVAHEAGPDPAEVEAAVDVLDRMSRRFDRMSDSVPSAPRRRAAQAASGHLARAAEELRAAARDLSRL